MLSKSMLLKATAIGIGMACSLQAFAANGVPDYDFQWVTIGDVNNPAYDGPTVNNYPPAGAGSVSYEYRISRLEITATQWLEFANAFGPMGDPYGFGREVDGNGAIRRVSSSPGTGVRYGLEPGENAENRFVQGISWRNAARYCNWLHNNKEPTVAAITTGAYDTTTFGGTLGNFTDASGHLPGAKFWIPTVDEWLKAVHYDPSKYDQNQGGWWTYPNGTDAPPAPGPSPFMGGDGQTNAGYDEFEDNLSFRVGAYPDTQTPWGLLDASGGASEWIETWRDSGYSRIVDGAPAGPFPWRTELDASWRGSSEWPTSSGGSIDVGLRIASAVPSPGSFCVVCVLAISSSLQRRSRS